MKEALRRRLGAVVRRSGLADGVVRDAFSRRLADLPGVTGRFYPYRDGAPLYVTRPPAGSIEATAEAKLPVPPSTFWVGLEADEWEFRDTGAAHVAALRDVLARTGYDIEAATRVLDFGCAAGRMIRWLADLAADREIWGVDIRARHIDWCNEHLRPPFHFLTTTTFPHLPFPDGYFDVICAASVLTAIESLADAWLMELRRVLAPGGRLYVTVHDNHSIDMLLSYPAGSRMHWLGDLLRRAERETKFLERDWSTLVLNDGLAETQVFHNRRYLEATWGRWFEILAIEEESYLFQSGLALTHPRGRSPSEVPRPAVT